MPAYLALVGQVRPAARTTRSLAWWHGKYTMQARDARLDALLRNTEACLESLAARLGVQQPASSDVPADAAGAAAQTCPSCCLRKAWGCSSTLACRTCGAAQAPFRRAVLPPALCTPAILMLMLGARQQLCMALGIQAHVLGAGSARWTALAAHKHEEVPQPAMLQGSLHPHQLQESCWDHLRQRGALG